MTLTLASLLPNKGRCQITPTQRSQIQSAIGNRIEALTILGGDYGIAGGTFRSTGRLQNGGTTDATLGISKLGGAGDIGDPQPLGGSGIGWQPRLSGNLGYIRSKNILEAPLLQNDVNTYKGYEAEFGGGARFWLGGALSVAPTLMVLYGHTTNSYIANSPFMQANLARAISVGIVGYSVDTWTIRPAVDLRYVLKLERTSVTFSVAPTYFHTESFHSSNANVSLNGDSESLEAKVDVDSPLGMRLFNHELHAGGYVSRTDLFGGLRDGLDVSHLNEIHGRLVLDFMNQLWKVQWIGFGASYIWGGTLHGWTAGADITFHF